MSYFNNNYYNPNNYNTTPTNYTSLNNTARYGITYATEEEVKAYILPPNAQMLALDREKSVFYVKSSDNLGRSMTETFKYEKVTNEPEKVKLPENYVTKEDLLTLIEIA